MWLLERMAGFGDAEAVVWRDRSVSYRELLACVSTWLARLDEAAVAPGRVVTLEGDYSPDAISLLLALVDRAAVVVPLTAAARAHRDEFLDIAEVETIFTFDASDGYRVEQTGRVAHNELTRRLRERGNPGLVLFSSGSTGKSKAALHDFAALLEKFRVPRNKVRAMTFLLLDHIGGMNTLLYALSNGGTAVAVGSRDPDAVCAAIARHRVQLLPTSPTFLNLLLMSEAHRRHDLSSLELITYGTEVMPETTLRRVHEVFPNVRLLQTYGLSEVGILRSKSRDSDSLWVKVGGEGYETKVVDGILFVRAQSAMLGYLNAPSPFDADGWMNTQDVVEVDGEWLRILGRKTDIINVGGQKVYPAEVESVLLQIDNVTDATVRGEPNAILGHVVTARLNLERPEDPDRLTRRVRTFCRERLASYKIPLRVEVAAEGQYGARYKKARPATG